MSEQQDAPLSSWSALVLAAGGSSRFGAHKLLADLGGAPVLRRSVSAACAAGLHETIVVAGAEIEAVAAALTDLPCKVVHAADWAEGMSASIRAGLAALRPDWQGLFLFLGDMPLAPAALCPQLAELAARTGYAARPLHGDAPGHPVAFTRAAEEDLRALSGDAGAGALLRRAGPGLGYLPTADEGATLDIDAPADLLRAEQLWKSRFTSDRIDSAMSRGALPNP